MFAFDPTGVLDVRPGGAPWTYDALKQSVTAQLSAAGSASMPRSPYPRDAEVWRRAARAAARSLGRTIRTTVEDDRVRAHLCDEAIGAA